MKYTDTFNKTGFTGLSMKGASPSEIEEVVGIEFQLPKNLKFGLHLTKCNLFVKIIVPSVKSKGTDVSFQVRNASNLDSFWGA